jgi:hypothetical protein
MSQSLVADGKVTKVEVAENVAEVNAAQAPPFLAPWMCQQGRIPSRSFILIIRSLRFVSTRVKPELYPRFDSRTRSTRCVNSAPHLTDSQQGVARPVLSQIWEFQLTRLVFWNGQRAIKIES